MSNLIQAVSSGNIDEIQMNISEAGRHDQKGRTALIIAAQKGNAEAIYLLLDKEGGMQDNAGWTALLHAVHNGKLECARLLICEAGIRSSGEAEGYPSGITALMVAAANGYVDTVTELCQYEHGLEDYSGNTALWYAQKSSHVDVVKKLKEKMPVRKQPPPKTSYALIAAATLGDLWGVKSNVAQAGQQDLKGQTALMRASRAGHVEIVRFLQEKEQRIRDEKGHTACFHAVMRKQEDCVKLLLMEGDMQDNSGQTIFEAFVDDDHIDILSHAFETLYETKDHFNVALEHGFRKYAIGIIIHQAGKQIPEGCTLLMAGAITGRVDLVSDNILELKKQDTFGRTALYHAISNDQKACAKLLLDEASIRDKNGTTAFAALIENYRALVLDLLRTMRDENRCHLLTEARAGNDNYVAHLLARIHGVDLSSQPTVLMHAAIAGYDNLIYHYRAQFGKTDQQGRTALMYAAEYGHLECARRLLCEARVVVSNCNQTLYFPVSSYNVYYKINTASLFAAKGNYEKILHLLWPYEYDLPSSGSSSSNSYTCSKLIAQKLQKKFTTPLPPPPKQTWKLLEAVCAGAYADIEESLDEAGTCASDGRTSLMVAVCYGDIAAVKLLLSEVGAQTTCPLQCLPAGMTALMFAALMGNLEMVELLLPYERGLTNSKGETAYTMAQNTDQPDSQLLNALESEASRLHLGRLRPPPIKPTHLILACLANDIDTAQKHLDEARKSDFLGVTALMHAAICGHVKLVALLRDKELHLQDRLGRTALMYAMQYCTIGCVKLLLDEADMEDEQGETALDLALTLPVETELSRKRDRCVQILQAHIQARSIGLRASMQVTNAVDIITMIQKSLRVVLVGEDAGRAEALISSVVSGLDSLKILADRAEINTTSLGTAAMSSAVQERLKTAEDEVARLSAELESVIAEKDGLQVQLQTVAELEAKLVEKTKEMDALARENSDLSTQLTKKSLELQSVTRVPPPILSGDGYTLDELMQLKENLTMSLGVITSAQAVLQTTSCVVCKAAPKNVVLHPCNHLCICEDCSVAMMGQPCPLCRTSVTEVHKIFL
ncbi:Ankyrin repeat protein 2 [Giardia muris]|uniref:Ankyrin repeat protein 2 n=1 Tax=Giardia muris TaxID=5742 RepID=A0A4Z1SLP5_GIAMU|nr:Ankyrin repeat protein 2 [Giardia muris]|eukprot:TNJ26586.1 Ankyrin repeat protein 2 [Giardia muris]